jgi:hypothetical protein
MTFWSLALIACLCGMGTMAIYRGTTDLENARRTVKRLVAHLAELRLYANEPALIWRAQLAAVRESARLFVVLAKPSLLTALPMAWLLVQLHSAYGLAPLPLGEPGIVTVHFPRALDLTDQAATLAAPQGIAVEAPPVRVIDRGEMSWRVRPLAAVRGALVLKLRGEQLTKSIESGPNGTWLSPRRSRSAIAFLIHPQEPRLPPGDVNWIEVSYPEALVRLGDLEMPWPIWFAVFATLGACLTGLLIRGSGRLLW